MSPKSEPQKITPTPTKHLIFDPWNSTSSGHQRSESNPGTSWQRTREAKLAQQLRTGDCTINSFTYSGRDRVYEKGEWEWDWGGDARQGRGGPGGGRGTRKEVVEGDSKQRDIRSMMKVNKAALAGPLSGKLEGGKEKGIGNPLDKRRSISTLASRVEIQPGPFTFGEPKTTITTPTTTSASTSTIKTNISPSTQQTLSDATTSTPSSAPSESTILRGAIVYINGQTAPMVSDHKLKQLLVAHGATLALSLSRRVTHVITGKPNSGPGRGAGGGLAAGKIQKEIQRGGWRGMRIVGVEWVLESIKAGKRLPETKFVVNLSNQRSVLAFM
ncbi:BRCT domain-containing protein [Aspergillus pseudoustus]|uniref:BRCT domain-containing protein n=1 Tax=Aspergillus pseudoustus TaxID=1810923 RepID=A0ABR4KE75_9EURO